MTKQKTLFEKRMENASFREKFEAHEKEFQLELQFLNALEKEGLTYEEFGKRINSSKGNVARDLKTKGLGRATLHRIEKMANALGLEFVPLLLPKNRRQRAEKLDQLRNQ